MKKIADLWGTVMDTVMDFRDFMDDEDSDTGGDSGIILEQLEQTTEEVEAVGDDASATTFTTADINSVDSPPKPQAQKKGCSSVVVIEEVAATPKLEIDKSKLVSQMTDTFARDTNDALKHQPGNKRSARESSAENSEDPSSVKLPREKRLKKENSKSTLEEQANSKPEIPEHEFKDVVRELNVELKQNLKEQGETIAKMKLEVEVGRERCEMQAETISQMEEGNKDLRHYLDEKEEKIAQMEDLGEKLEKQIETVSQMEESNEDQNWLKENLGKKEEAISEIRELIADLRNNRDGLSMKMEPDQEKQAEDLKQMRHHYCCLL